MLETTGNDNRAHVIRFCAYCYVAFFARALQGTLNQVTSGSVTGRMAQNLLDFLVGKVVMDAVGAEQDTVSYHNGDVIHVYGGRHGTTQGLRDAAAQAEVTEFYFGKFLGAHGLVNAPGVSLFDHLAFHQPP